MNKINRFHNPLYFQEKSKNLHNFENKLNKPIDDFNHLMDAMRYALEGFIRGETFSFD